MVKNKRGWLKIFEASIAIIIILSTILIIRNLGTNTEVDNNYIIDLEGEILRELSESDELRMEIVNGTNWENVSIFIKERLPSNWNFSFRVCNSTGPCEFEEDYPNTEVFVQERAIYGVLSKGAYSNEWRRIRLFVWRKF